MSTFAVERHGIILKTERYEACLAFYRDGFRLPVEFANDFLTCLSFGSAYLMIEHGGPAAAQPRSLDQNPTVLRFNVADIGAATSALAARGIAAEIQRHDWGTIAICHDPDGNQVELRDHFDGQFASRDPS